MSSVATLLPRTSRLLPGVLLALFLGWVSLALGALPVLQQHGFGALTLAIALGITVGNTLYPVLAAGAASGVDFSKHALLRTGIVLYGLRLTVQDIGQVGGRGVLIDVVVIASTFLLACFAGTRWLGLDRRSAMLIGAGSAVCGAAAVMATQPVVRARPEQVSVAIATVVVFGTISIFLYPLLFALERPLDLIPGGLRGFGVYAGSTIHEVAQVVAAARAIGPEAADAAVIAKMVRVMLLAPGLVLLSAWLSRRSGVVPGSAAASTRAITVPWFAFGFVAVVLLNSLQLAPHAWIALANQFDTLMLATAMAALGLGTHVSALRKAGVRPLLLGALLSGWLVLGGAAINRALGAA